LKLTSIALALLALAAGLVITGCGDDDDDDSTATTTEETATTDTGGDTESKAQFIAAADEICTQADRELANEAVEQYPEGPPTGEDATAFAEEVVIPNLQGQYDQISTLTPPAGEEDAVADILEKLQAGIDELSDNPGEFVESTALEDATTAAQEFGLKKCGQ
jgi:hypothetical protein